MSTHEQQTSIIPTSVVRNTRGKSGPQNLEEPASNEALRELCDKNYHQLLPLIAEKMQKEKKHQDKLKASREEGMDVITPEARHQSLVSSRDLNKTDFPHLGPGRGRMEVCSLDWEEKNQARLHALIITTRVPKQREPRYWQESIIMRAHCLEEPADILRVKTAKGVTGSPNQKGTSQILTGMISPDLGRVKKAVLSRPGSDISTSQGQGCLAMSRHMMEFVSTNSQIDSYEDLRAAFRENYRQQTKHIKDPVEIHHIKKRDGESTEDFIERYKEEVLDVEGAPECMKIFGFLHGITHPELIKRLYEKIPRSMDEMYRVTTSFLQGEVAAFSHGRKKAPAPWKQPDGGNKPNFKKGFKNKHMPERKPDRFSLLTKTPKEIFALEKGKFKAPPPMLRKQIDEMIKAGKLSQFIKELKQNYKSKTPKKGETVGKERPLAILMIHPWDKVARQKVTQSFSSETIIFFPPLGDEDGTEGPMIIEAEIGGHFVHRMLRPEIRSQMIMPTTYLTRFSGETIWPLGQISLLVKIGDERHSTSAWMNFMVVRLPSQHNGIIGRPGIRKIHAIPSMAHEMLKFPVEGGTITLRSSRIIPMECAMISRPSTRPPEAGKILEEKIRVVIHPEYPEQKIAIGSTLMEKGRKELCTLLGQNLDVFAWKPADMTGVPQSIAEHCLNIQEGCQPVRKKKRGQAPERNKAIQEEVEKLVDAGIMKEVNYHSWLSNPVMVKKHDGTWRMCVDFKDLNNACPKDCYPLP
ncbi:hypothetical protein Tco_1144727 [Tanacetum coccineum]